MWRVHLSRLLNRALLGSPGECFCARVHRRRWVVAEVIIDCAAVALGGRPGHCARIAEWERATPPRSRLMHRLTLLIIFGMIVIAAAAAVAQPAPPCGPVAAVLGGLMQRYGESVVWRGLDAQGRVMIVTMAPGGGWSLLAVSAPGEACMVSAGEAGVTVAPEPPGRDG